MSVFLGQEVYELKSVFVTEKTLDSMWFRLLKEVSEHGRKNPITYGSFAGSNRLEFDFAAGTIEFPTTRPLAPIMPEGVPPVTTDEKIESYFVEYIMDGTLTDNNHYKYATWISGGVYVVPKVRGSVVSDGKTVRGIQEDDVVILRVPNQVDWIIDHYKKRGHGNNHCYIQVGYPESSFAYDIPWKTEAERQTSPCLRGIDTHIKDGALHMAATFRSWDLYAGFPENMGGITMLMEYMANEIGVKTGPLSFSCLKLHCYDYQLEAVKARLNEE
jgi:thymidylate synthase